MHGVSLRTEVLDDQTNTPGLVLIGFGRTPGQGQTCGKSHGSRTKTCGSKTFHTLHSHMRIDATKIDLPPAKVAARLLGDAEFVHDQASNPSGIGLATRGAHDRANQRPDGLLLALRDFFDDVGMLFTGRVNGVALAL